MVGLSFFDRLICSYDGPGVSAAADTHGPWEQLATGRRSGLTANVQQAWDALGDDEWVFHVEEDFLVLDAPRGATVALWSGDGPPAIERVAASGAPGWGLAAAP